ELPLSVLEWELSTTPVPIPGYSSTSHLMINSLTTHPDVLATIEDELYGTEGTIPRLPSVTEILSLFDSHAIFTVVDNGDHSYTISGPDDAIFLMDEEERAWMIDYISVEQLSE